MTFKNTIFRIADAEARFAKNTTRKISNKITMFKINSQFISDINRVKRVALLNLSKDELTKIIRIENIQVKTYRQQEDAKGNIQNIPIVITPQILIFYLLKVPYRKLSEDLDMIGKPSLSKSLTERVNKLEESKTEKIKKYIKN